MTVSSQTSNETFFGNGVTTVWDLPFRFFNDSDINVYLTDTSTNTTIPMVLGTDYTLSGAGLPEQFGTAPGKITTVIPVAIGSELYVERVMSLEQLTDIINQGEFFPEIHEDVFDRLTMLLQQIGAEARGAIRVAIGDPEPARLSNAASRVGKLLSFDSLGNPVAIAASNQSATDLELRLADKVNPANGAKLVGYKGRTVADVLGETTSPFDHGAFGDGVTDDTVALNLALATGKPIDLGDEANTFLFSSQLAIPANATIYGKRATLKFTASSVTALILTGDNIKLEGFKVSGPDPVDTYVANSVAIGGNGSVSDYLKNISINLCEITGFGQSGIFLQFVENLVIAGNKIENLGYSGIHILSGTNCLVYRNRIDRCYPGSGGGIVGASAAYGISVTRNAGVSTAVAPASKNISVDSNIINGVLTWEGLDTHGGNGVSFVNNHVENCWVGGNIIHADGGGSIVPALACEFVGNTFIAGNQPGAAIYVKPSSGTVVGDGGQVGIVGNIISRYGTYSTAVSSQGAIYAENCTSGMSITGNQFYECKWEAIRLYAFCYGVTITANTFKDMITVASTNRAISCDTASISAVISANTFIRTSGSMDAVYIGFSAADVTVSDDNTYVGTITKFSGVLPQGGTARLGFQAKANINGTTGAIRSGVGLTCSRTGVGAYTITLDEPMKTTNYIPHITSNQPITILASIVSTTVFTITTQSSIGVAADAGLLLVSVGSD